MLTINSHFINNAIISSRLFINVTFMKRLFGIHLVYVNSYSSYVDVYLMVCMTTYNVYYVKLETSNIMDSYS